MRISWNFDLLKERNHGTLLNSSAKKPSGASFAAEFLNMEVSVVLM
jgi:hypothetical protein